MCVCVCVNWNHRFVVKYISDIFQKPFYFIVSNPQLSCSICKVSVKILLYIYQDDFGSGNTM